MTAARPDTWMPLYWGDYLRDTGHLAAAEHGAYLLLIGHYWTTGKPLINDDVLLARIARMAPKEWKLARRIIEPFFQVAEGLWTHKRITEELAKWERLIESKSNAGKASAEAKAQRKAQQNVNTSSTPVATEPATDTPTKINPSPSPSPSPSPEVIPPRPSDVPPPSAEEEPKAKRRKATLPDDWALSEEKAKRAAAEHPDMDIPTEIEKFKAHHIHHQTLGVDWDRAFMVTWLLKAEEIAQRERQRIPAFLDRNKPSPGKIAVQDSSPEKAEAAKKAREWDERKAHLVREARYGKDREGAKTELKSMGYDAEGRPLRKEVA